MAQYYLAGPMRGYDSFNFPAFAAATDLLRATGLTIISPAEHDLEVYPDWDPASNSLEGMSLEDSIRWDNEVICDPKTKGIIMLPGWEKSSGACLERAIAKALGKKIYSFYPANNFKGHVLKQQFDDETPPTPTPVEVEVESRAPYTSVTEMLAHCREAAQDLPTGERRIRNEETGGEKGQKQARFDLIPSKALWCDALLYGKGAEKYAERNWELGYDWSLSYAALQRHANLFWQGEDIDPELGLPHLSCVRFHAAALIEFAETHPELDDRPKR